MSFEGMAGIVITVLIGLIGFFVAKKVYTKKQNQKIGIGGTGYQAGRDIRMDKKGD